MKVKHYLALFLTFLVLFGYSSDKYYYKKISISDINKIQYLQLSITEDPTIITDEPDYWTTSTNFYGTSQRPLGSSKDWSKTKHEEAEEKALSLLAVSLASAFPDNQKIEDIFNPKNFRNERICIVTKESKTQINNSYLLYINIYHLVGAHTGSTNLHIPFTYMGIDVKIYTKQGSLIYHRRNFSKKWNIKSDFNVSDYNQYIEKSLLKVAKTFWKDLKL